MPYLSGVTNDIFISYASVDNEPDPQGVHWVSRFRNDLETELRRRLGKDVEIFFDQSGLRATQKLEELLKNVRGSAIFLAVCSPSYVEREWTRDELKAFQETPQGSGESNRLVTIEILQVPIADLPPGLENLKRTRFYTIDEDNRIPLQITPASAPNLYNERLAQLAHHLVLLLREIRDKTAAEPAPALAPTAERDGKAQAGQPAQVAAVVGEPLATVLLAQVTDDVYDERQRVAAYLEDYKVKVIPAAEYPESGPLFAKAVLSDLEHAELFVQLLGRVRSNNPGDLRFEGELTKKSCAQFQYDAAQRRGIPILQWRHPDIDLEKLPPVNTDRLLLQGPNVRAMGLQDFMKEVRTAVASLHQKEAPKTPPSGDFIFINAERSDQDIAQTLLSGFKAKDRYALLPMDDDAASAKEVEEDLEANLIGCKSLLLVYGKASLGWVRAQIRRIIKLENRRQEPFRVKSILRGPPPTKPDPGVAGFTVIDWPDGASAERVEDILTRFQL